MLLKEKEFEQQMQEVVLPYLLPQKKDYYLERISGQQIHVVRYLADNPKGILLISHGFTEAAEKYSEVFYYFLQNHFHVYLPEHCGHGNSYRLVQDPSLVHVDCYERYVEDWLYVTKCAKKEHHNMELYVFAHSMGGGIAAAALARRPELYRRAVLSTPMIRPQTGSVPWLLASFLAKAACLPGKGTCYVTGQHPFDGMETFEESASMSEARFRWYQKLRKKNTHLQMNAASFQWFRETGRLNRYLKKQALKGIQTLTLICQAGQDSFVSNKESEYFSRCLEKKGIGKIEKFKYAKHEIYNASDSVLEEYWWTVMNWLH